MNLQHRLPDGSSKLPLALKSLGVSIGSPALHDGCRQLGADTTQCSLRVPDGLGDLAERWGRDGVGAYEGLNPLSDGRVIVTIAW
jgi:hypothetical protein